MRKIVLAGMIILLAAFSGCYGAWLLTVEGPDLVVICLDSEGKPVEGLSVNLTYFADEVRQTDADGRVVFESVKYDKWNRTSITSNDLMQGKNIHLTPEQMMLDVYEFEWEL